MRKILQKVSAQQITVGPSKVTHRLDRSFIYGEVSSRQVTKKSHHTSEINNTAYQACDQIVVIGSHHPKLHGLFEEGLNLFRRAVQHNVDFSSLFYILQ